MLIDDEEDLLESCARILEDEDFTCVTTSDSENALELARRHRPGVVVTDFKMPGKNGMEILKEVRGEFPDIPVIMISAYTTVDGVVEAVKKGAFDYITKPFTADQLTITVRRAMQQFCLRKENTVLKKKLEDDFFNHYFVGKHPEFLQAVELIQKVANTESNVLIQGETGTGKELAARAIHLRSGRADGPFIAVDCTTLTKEMLEAAPAGGSEAKENQRKSVFEAADGGVLYLERVEDLDLGMQARLLRVLQDQKVMRGGEWEWVPIDTRVIASTTIDLRGAMAQKNFRENLYYCLNVVSVKMPPLRDRKEDIGILCDHFFRLIAEKTGGQPLKLEPEALTRLMEYDWPGNVRQLRNVIEGAASVSENGVVKASALPDEIRPTSNLQGLSFKEARKRWLEQFERCYLENLLINNAGNISKASEEAGVARMSLYRMLERTGLKGVAPHGRFAGKSQSADKNPGGRKLE